MLIDVREADEFAAARIDGAILAPLSQMPAAWEALDLPADKKIIVQCLKGGRSHQVCAFVGPAGPDGQPPVQPDRRHPGLARRGPSGGVRRTGLISGRAASR